MYILACHLRIGADPDPDQAYYFDADLDPAYHFDTDADREPDPLPFSLMQIHTDPDPVPQR